jgi:hypothetical protein
MPRKKLNPDWQRKRPKLRQEPEPAPDDDSPYYTRRTRVRPKQTPEFYKRDAARRRNHKYVFKEKISAGLQRLFTVQCGTGTRFVYDEAILDQAYKYALLGCNNREIGQLFGIDSSTLDHWMRDTPGLRDAIECGRDLADAEVARALYQRARGYSHPDVKIFYDKDSGEIIKVPFTRYYPPDASAAGKWLANRRRHKDMPWNDANVSIEFENNANTDDSLPLPVIIINPVQSAPRAPTIEGKAEPNSGER